MIPPLSGLGTKPSRNTRYNPPPARDLHLLTAGQLYHSIHAKGENVDDVLRAADEEESGQAEPVDAEEQMETGGESPAVVPTVVPVEGQVCIYIYISMHTFAARLYQ